MKFLNFLAGASLTVVVLSGCSGSAGSLRQANGDFDYLDAKPLVPWIYVPNATFETYPDYNIPPQQAQIGDLGKHVDIRPPQHILNLIQGVRVEYKTPHQVIFWTVSDELSEKLWKTTLDYVKGSKIVAQTQRNVSGKDIDPAQVVASMTTDWVSWPHLDLDIRQRGQYQFERIKEGQRYGLRITLMDYETQSPYQAQKQQAEKRYLVTMSNNILMKYESVLREQEKQKALLAQQNIFVSMGVDRTGLSVIIARTRYNTLWERLPRALTQIGFTVSEKHQSKGEMKFDYSPADQAVWEALKVSPLSLKKGEYTVLFGDLENRTSINVTDSKGKPLSEQKLRELVPVFAAVLKAKTPDATQTK